MIVVDASIVLKIFMDDLKDNEIERKLEISDGLIAPQIIDVEVINGIRKNLRLGNITQVRAAQAILDLQAFPVERMETVLLISRIWQLRNNFTPYDASYVALAEDYQVPFLTRDLKLAAAVKAHTKVELI